MAWKDNVIHMITRQQYQQLKQLKKAITSLKLAEEELLQLALSITKETQEGGYTFDWLMNDFHNIDLVMSKLGIEVQ